MVRADYSKSFKAISSCSECLDFTSFYLIRDEIEKKRKGYLDFIASEANKYIAQLNEQQQKATKEISDIREKFNVHKIA